MRKLASKNKEMVALPVGMTVGLLAWIYLRPLFWGLCVAGAAFALWMLSRTLKGKPPQ